MYHIRSMTTRRHPAATVTAAAACVVETPPSSSSLRQRAPADLPGRRSSDVVSVCLTVSRLKTTLHAPKLGRTGPTRSWCDMVNCDCMDALLAGTMRNCSTPDGRTDERMKTRISLWLYTVRATPSSAIPTYSAWCGDRELYCRPPGVKTTSLIRLKWPHPR